jgi:hypothetical protein
MNEGDLQGWSDWIAKRSCRVHEHSRLTKMLKFVSILLLRGVRHLAYAVSHHLNPTPMIAGVVRGRLYKHPPPMLAVIGDSAHGITCHVYTPNQLTCTPRSVECSTAVER